MISDQEIIAFLACAYNESVVEEISEKYEFEVTGLEGGRKYLNSESFKSKKVTADNFEKCVQYVLKRANIESFREELHERDICFIKFYDKFDDSGNLLNKNPMLEKLNTKIVKKEIVGDILKIYIHPIKRWKEEIYFSKPEIIDFFIKNGKEIKDVEIMYCHLGEVLDDVANELIDIGFSMESENKKR